MKLEPRDPTGFRKIIEAISVCLDTTVFEVDKKGLRVESVGISRVDFIYLNLSPRFFTVLECDQMVEFKIPVMDLAKILKRATKNDTVVLELDQSMENKLKVTISRVNGTSKKFSVTLVTMDGIYDDDTTKYEDFQVDQTVRVVMEPGTLEEVLADVGIISTDIEIEFTSSVAEFSALDISGDVTCKLPRKMFTRYDVDEVTRSKFSLGPLTSGMKMLSAGGKLTLLMADESPVALESEISGGGKLAYVLAPLLDTDLDVEGISFDDDPSVDFNNGDF